MYVKKMLFFIFSLILLFSFMSHAYAEEMLIVTGDAVRFRSEPNTSNSENIYMEFNKGIELVLLDKEIAPGNGCDVNWYKAQYGSYEGYICSKYVRIETVTVISPEDYETYNEYLLALGFPEGYISKLVELHEKHPKWKFQVMDSEIDFNTLVDKEYNFSRGWNLLWDSNRSLDGYKSFDSWAYNYLTDTFNQKIEGGGTNWYVASKQTIGYYIDPRNFLNERYIFMFEKLSYNANYHNKTGIEIMLKGTFMDGKLADTEKNKTYADAFLDAAVTNGLSPYMLVARVIQEVRAEGSAIVSGTVSGYEGYYNFYNIGAYAYTSSDTIKNGLKYAKNKGWNTPYKAIVGGASFLGDDYISIGQDTEYLQKWDILADPNIVNHQYMQNLQAPYSQASKTYDGYKEANLIDSEFTFVIPVFENMPEKTELANKGNPNNYLSSLTINGVQVFGEASNETEYNLSYSLATTSLKIEATTVSSKAKITGVGNILLTLEEEIIPIVVTAENGDVRTYNLKVTRSDEVEMEINEILSLLKLNSKDNYISGFKLGTDISSIINNIIDKEAKAIVSVLDKDGKEKTSGIVATGDKIKIKTTNEEKEYSVIIYGDVSGDGKIDKVDAAAILRYYYKYTSYEGEFKIAADVSRDNKIDKVDVAAVLRDVYDYASIEQ